MITLWVRDNKTKTNNQHEFYGSLPLLYYRASLAYILEEAKEELDELYPHGYTVSF